MAILESRPMERKIISVSPKRQITIPLKFFRQVGLGSQVECRVQDGAIVIRPLPSDEGEFSVEILKDLVAQGYQGEELVAKFAEHRARIKDAIGRLVNEADEIAAGKRKGASLRDVFGEE